MALSDIFSMQPYLVTSMHYFYLSKSCWNHNQENMKVYYEEFSNHERDVIIDILPDGFSTICFEIGPHTCTAIYFGKTPKQKTVYYQKGYTYFTVKIPPNYILPDTIDPIKTYQNKVTRLNKFTHAFDEFNYDNLYALSFQDKITYFQTYTASHLDLMVDPLIDYVVTRSIENHETVFIDTIAQELEVSSRYIRKVFSEKVGISPKRTIQSIRFQNVLSGLIDDKKGITETSLDAAFFDHPHLNKFFKEHANRSPSDVQLFLSQKRTQRHNKNESR